MLASSPGDEASLMHKHEEQCHVIDGGWRELTEERWQSDLEVDYEHESDY